MVTRLYSIAIILGCICRVSEGYPYALSPWNAKVPYSAFPQPNYVYRQAPPPSMDNPADFGNGLSNPPPVPPGYNPNYIPWSHWSVMTGNVADPYAYKNYAQPGGLPPMTGIVLNGRQVGQGGYARGLFPVPANQVG